MPRPVRARAGLDAAQEKIGLRWLAHDASAGANKFTCKDADRLDALLDGAHATDPALAHREVVLVLGPGQTIDTRIVVPRVRARNVRITGAERMAELEGIAEKMLVD